MDKPRSTGQRKGNPLQYSYHESPVTSMKKHKDMTPEDESPRSEGVQYVTMEEQTINSPRKNEVAWPKQKRPSVVGVSGYESKI